MKVFKKVVLEAKNSPAGSYAAGCPTNTSHGGSSCRNCEVSM